MIKCEDCDEDALVKGGQGHTAESLKRSASALMWACLAAGIFIGVVIAISVLKK